MIAKDQITQFSKQWGIDEFTVIREYIQAVFLSVLYQAKFSDEIYFKGGTAIRLLLKSNRFSEDLDFTSSLSATSVARLVESVLKKVRQVIPGIQFNRTKEFPFAYTGRLSYRSEDMKHPLTVHLDFFLRGKPETSAESVLETDFPVRPLPVIRHLDWPEILAEKIRAFLYRLKGRDVYDLWVLLSQGIDLDWFMINRKTKLYNIKTSLHDLIARVEEFDNRQLKNDLSKFLPASDRKLIAQLKTLVVKQLKERERLTISQSNNLDHSIDSGRIKQIMRSDENSLEIKLTENNKEWTAYIRARNRNGIRELNVIERKRTQFIGKTYNDFINHVVKSL